MDNKKNNIILADCSEDEILPIKETLFYEDQQFEVKSHIANWKRTGKASELKRYFKYFTVAFSYFLKRKKINAIVGWQQFYTLIFCFYCSVFHVKKTNVTVALNFTYKEKCGKLAKPYKWFMKKCVDPKYMDYVHVPSSDYAKSFSEDFNFPISRIIITPFGVLDEFERLCDLPAPKDFPKDSYALAIGRSNRDYDFLIKAWENIDFPLVIISDTYKGTIGSSNITLLSNVAGEESYPWIVNCGLMIIPIDDGTICSGDTVLLTAMSMKRRILVTEPSTLAEMYIKDGVNAILSPKNYDCFSHKVNEVLHSQVYSNLGERARESFLENFTRSSMGRKITNILNSNN